MANGDHVFRSILVVPVGQKMTGVVNWIKANLDPTEDAANWPGLSPTGEAPATHAWSNRALTDPEAKALLLRFCDLVNQQNPGAVEKPTGPQWSAWSKDEKKAWLTSVRNKMWTGWGVAVSLAIQDSAWDDPETLLALAGLKRIERVEAPV